MTTVPSLPQTSPAFPFSASPPKLLSSTLLLFLPPLYWHRWHLRFISIAGHQLIFVFISSLFLSHLASIHSQLPSFSGRLELYYTTTTSEPHLFFANGPVVNSTPPPTPAGLSKILVISFFLKNRKIPFRDNSQKRTRHLVPGPPRCLRICSN